MCVSQNPLPNLPHLEFRINSHYKSSVFVLHFWLWLEAFVSYRYLNFGVSFLNPWCEKQSFPFFLAPFPPVSISLCIFKASPLWAGSGGSAQLCARCMPGNLKAAVTRCDRTWLPWFLLLKNVQSQVCGGATDTVIGFTELTDVNTSWLCVLQPWLDRGCVCIYSGARWS